MVGMISDIGNVREINEDYADYYQRNNVQLYVIADGMGGHNAGEVASKMAVENVIKYFKTVDNLELIDEVLIAAVKYANYEIYHYSLMNDELIGMGTTIVACIVAKDEMFVANVGDSNCHVIIKDKIIKITKDHSLVQELIDNGTISEEEATKHPKKNVITRALGTSKEVLVDIFKVDLKEVSKVVLCTDGVTNSVIQKEMYDIIVKNDNMDACRGLVELSKAKGGRDNLTAIVFEGECK